MEFRIGADEVFSYRPMKIGAGVRFRQPDNSFKPLRDRRGSSSELRPLRSDHGPSASDSDREVTADVISGSES